MTDEEVHAIADAGLFIMKHSRSRCQPLYKRYRASGLRWKLNEYGFSVAFESIRKTKEDHMSKKSTMKTSSKGMVKGGKYGGKVKC